MALRKSCKERRQHLTDNRSPFRKHWTFAASDVFLFLYCVDWKLALLLVDLTSFTELVILLPAFPTLPFSWSALLPDKLPFPHPLRRGMFFFLIVSASAAMSPSPFLVYLQTLGSGGSTYYSAFD